MVWSHQKYKMEVHRDTDTDTYKYKTVITGTICMSLESNNNVRSNVRNHIYILKIVPNCS